MLLRYMFRGTNPTSLGEDEVSAILDATGGRVERRTGDVRFLLQSQWEKSMQAELVPSGIDLFDLREKDERRSAMARVNTLQQNERY